jgi:lactoylglutathione lyase
MGIIAQLEFADSCSPLARTGTACGRSCVMNERAKAGREVQMRLVVEAPDYEQAVVFYRDVLGAPEELVVEGDQDERVTILDVGRATLEIANPAQVAMIDDVEVGRRVAPRLRVAFEVTDARGVTGDLVEGGAELIAEPTVTPWRSLNSRLSAPGDLQITVFEELGSKAES